MTRNLSFRIGTIMLGGFLLLQLAIVLLMAVPGRGGNRATYGLPSPSAMAQMVSAMEAAGPRGADDLAASYGGSLFTVEIAREAPAHFQSIPDSMRVLAGAYRSALADHNVVIDGGPGWLSRFSGAAARRIGLLTPLRVSVWLRDSRVLIVTGRPSEGVRAYLLRRGLTGLMGGLALMLVLLIAVRQTTGPLVRLAAHVRSLSGNLETPDIKAEGSREIRDLTEAFNQMKHRIRDLVAERTFILAGIAHDMRTYLTRLTLRAELIDDPDQRDRAAADIEAMATLLDNSLLFARLSDGEATQTEAIDLVLLTRHLAEEWHPAERERIAADLPGDPVMVRGNREALTRIFQNLVGNGLRHGQAVSVTIAAEEARVVWCFEDDGPGVADDDLPALGKPFLRLDPSRDRRSGGAGLGLAIIRGLVQSMHGSLRFYRASAGGLGIAVTLQRWSVESD